MLKEGSERKAKKKKERGLFSGNLLNDALDALSVPVAAVTSTAANIGRAGGRIAGKDYGDNNPSLGHWWEQIVKPEHQIHGIELWRGGENIGNERGLLGKKGYLGSYDNPYVLGALGFATEAAVDPLSYVMPIGKASGAREAAGEVAEGHARDGCRSDRWQVEVQGYRRSA
jgi:hypothetical protein